MLHGMQGLIMVIMASIMVTIKYISLLYRKHIRTSRKMHIIKIANNLIIRIWLCTLNFLRCMTAYSPWNFTSRIQFECVESSLMCISIKYRCFFQTDRRLLRPFLWHFTSLSGYFARQINVLALDHPVGRRMCFLESVARDGRDLACDL